MVEIEKMIERVVEAAERVAWCKEGVAYLNLPRPEALKTAQVVLKMAKDDLLYEIKAYTEDALSDTSLISEAHKEGYEDGYREGYSDAQDDPED
jgi:flagellar biosynthesis/type III secretory pathway protein FliH